MKQWNCHLSLIKAITLTLSATYFPLDICGVPRPSYSQIRQPDYSLSFRREIFRRYQKLLFSRTLVTCYSTFFLQNKTGLINLDPETYYVSELPFDFNFSSIVFLNIGVLVLCFLMLILPSLVITKISPSESVKIN